MTVLAATCSPRVMMLWVRTLVHWDQVSSTLCSVTSRPPRVPAACHVSQLFIVLSSTFTFQVRRQSCQLIITQTQFINFILEKKLKLHINNRIGPIQLTC